MEKEVSYWTGRGSTGGEERTEKEKREETRTGGVRRKNGAEKRRGREALSVSVVGF